MAQSRTWRLEKLVHGVFIAGLAASALLLIVGVTVVLFAGEPRPQQAPHAGEILRRSLHGDALGWIYAGLLALMLMPVVRVVLLAIGFARQREWRFAAAALIVLAALLVSFRLGMR